jgi:hypothetical protein
MDDATLDRKHRLTQSSYLMLEVILLAALFVRVWGLSAYAYNGDEMQFLLIAKGGTWDEIWKRSLFETHPPLLHLTRHYLLMLGTNIFMQRLFSVASGLFAVFGMYQIGVLLRGQAMGVFYALCMAFAMLAVSTSVTIRDYAFFMMFLLGAFYYFIRYQQDYALRNLLCFAVLLFLACATSFGGFLFAAACGTFEAYRLQKAKRWNTLNLFCLSFVPLALLAAVFYMSYAAAGTYGAMWKHLAIATGFYPANLFGAVVQTLLNLYYFFVPFGGVRNFPHDGIIARFVVIGMFLGSFYFILLQIRGLRAMREKNYPLFCFTVLLWAIALLASFAGIYPFAANRQSYYLLPFFILPYGYLLEAWVERVLYSRALTRASAIVILMFAVIMGASGVYMGFADELTLKQTELDAGQRYLSTHLHPHDAIVTGGSAAYFYLLDAKDDGETFYGSYGQTSYTNGTTLLAGFDSPYKPHITPQALRDELIAENDTHIVPPDGKLWFVQYGWKNNAIWRLMECGALKNSLEDFMSREGIVIFSIRQPAFAAFLQNDEAWKQCFTGYKPLYMGIPFHTVKMP